MEAPLFVALERFELPQAEPESDVLPLHHKAISLSKKLVLCFCAAKLLRFFKPRKFFEYFFKKNSRNFWLPQLTC